MRLLTLSSEETREADWVDSAVSEQLEQAGRAGRRGGMWLSVVVGRRIHVLVGASVSGFDLV